MYYLAKQLSHAQGVVVDVSIYPINDKTRTLRMVRFTVLFYGFIHFLKYSNKTKAWNEKMEDSESRLIPEGQSRDFDPEFFCSTLISFHSVDSTRWKLPVLPEDMYSCGETKKQKMVSHAMGQGVMEWLALSHPYIGATRSGEGVRVNTFCDSAGRMHDSNGQTINVDENGDVFLLCLECKTPYYFGFSKHHMELEAKTLKFY